jgi:NNP family nitrate/nitrite transporter-like MFS transporter
MGPEYGVDPAGKFLLTALPAALGSMVRLPYTFAIAKFGGRNWTVFSALMLLLPCVLAAIFLKPGVSYGTLLVVACVAGVGGGNFASSMANINTLYPDRLKGWALGINAGGGNLGVAVVQLVGLAVLATAGREHPRLMLAFYIPVVVLAALGAYLRMDNLSQVKQNDKRAMRDVLRDGHTYIMSILYIGTFGSFIGYSFAFGQVLQVQFKAEFATPITATYLTFLGPLIGSLIRPVGGWLSDRVSGAKVTLAVFVLMACSAGVVLLASVRHSLPLFIVGFLALFFFSGVGNGSTYKMIPRIFWSKAAVRMTSSVEQGAAERDARRLSGALIGIAGAVGAFGGVLINVAFRESFLAYKSGNAAYAAFISFYVICVVVTWAVYLRSSGKRLSAV